MPQATSELIGKLISRSGAPRTVTDAPMIRLLDDDGYVTAEAVTWAFHCFIGREPRDAAEITFHRNHRSFGSLRKAFTQTQEFATYQRGLNGARPQAYRAPMWLLRPPEDRRIRFEAGPPSIGRPVSQLCTQGQLEDPVFLGLMEELAVSGTRLHRKLWEFGYILAVLKTSGVLRPGARGLGFGVGREPLPSLFAKYQVDVLATDAPTELDARKGWTSTGQHSADLDAVHLPKIVDRDTFLRHVAFAAVDMNDIPADLREFDFCWSACCFEHLGSLEHGLRFFENSLRCLRPGGIAVHTTEFNLSSNDETFEHPNTSIYRRQDIERLMSRLLEAGHEVWPLNLHPGDGLADEHIDLPPYAIPHLKLELARHTCTSIGVVARRRP